MDSGPQVVDSGPKGVDSGQQGVDSGRALIGELCFSNCVRSAAGHTRECPLDVLFVKSGGDKWPPVFNII